MNVVLVDEHVGQKPPYFCVLFGIVEQTSLDGVVRQVVESHLNISYRISLEEESHL